ncbi:hypothetical protein ACICHK_39370 [Streptomyces sp. AHU1]|uniref:hypothetical protein n=1 Tax=Streptomyces sp. AHU1 TaxID=3377215 RepID=UPI0038780C1A
MVEVGTAHPEPGGGLIGPQWGVGGDQVRQVLTLADLRNLFGAVQRSVRVRSHLLNSTDEGETDPVDVWTACVTWSERILEAVDRIAGERVDRLERYRTWSMAPVTAEALLKTLLALVSTPPSWTSKPPPPHGPRTSCSPACHA